MALQYALREYVAFFFFYSALGWVGEVAFAALTERQLVNRGFLNGPLCPLYGSGMVLMAWNTVMTIRVGSPRPAFVPRLVQA